MESPRSVDSDDSGSKSDSSWVFPQDVIERDSDTSSDYTKDYEHVERTADSDDESAVGSDVSSQDLLKDYCTVGTPLVKRKTSATIRAIAAFAALPLRIALIIKESRFVLALAYLDTLVRLAFRDSRIPSLVSSVLHSVKSIVVSLICAVLHSVKRFAFALAYVETAVFEGLKMLWKASCKDLAKISGKVQGWWCRARHSMGFMLAKVQDSRVFDFLTAVKERLAACSVGNRVFFAAVRRLCIFFAVSMVAFELSFTVLLHMHPPMEMSAISADRGCRARVRGLTYNRSRNMDMSTVKPHRQAKKVKTERGMYPMVSAAKPASEVCDAFARAVPVPKREMTKKSYGPYLNSSQDSSMIVHPSSGLCAKKQLRLPVLDVEDLVRFLSRQDPISTHLTGLTAARRDFGLRPMQTFGQPQSVAKPVEIKKSDTVFPARTKHVKPVAAFEKEKWENISQFPTPSRRRMQSAANAFEEMKAQFPTPSIRRMQSVANAFEEMKAQVPTPSIRRMKPVAKAFEEMTAQFPTPSIRRREYVAKTFEEMKAQFPTPSIRHMKSVAKEFEKERLNKKAQVPSPNMQRMESVAKAFEEMKAQFPTPSIRRMKSVAKEFEKERLNKKAQVPTPNLRRMESVAKVFDEKKFQFPTPSIRRMESVAKAFEKERLNKKAQVPTPNMQRMESVAKAFDEKFQFPTSSIRRKESVAKAFESQQLLAKKIQVPTPSTWSRKSVAKAIEKVKSVTKTQVTTPSSVKSDSYMWAPYSRMSPKQLWAVPNTYRQVKKIEKIAKVLLPLNKTHVPPPPPLKKMAVEATKPHFPAWLTELLNELARSTNMTLARLSGAGFSSPMPFLRQRDEVLHSMSPVSRSSSNEDTTPQSRASQNVPHFANVSRSPALAKATPTLRGQKQYKEVTPRYAGERTFRQEVCRREKRSDFVCTGNGLCFRRHDNDSYARSEATAAPRKSLPKAPTTSRTFQELYNHTSPKKWLTARTARSGKKKTQPESKSTRLMNLVFGESDSYPSRVFKAMAQMYQVPRLLSGSIDFRSVPEPKPLVFRAPLAAPLSPLKFSPRAVFPPKFSDIPLLYAMPEAAAKSDEQCSNKFCRAVMKHLPAVANHWNPSQCASEKRVGPYERPLVVLPGVPAMCAVEEQSEGKKQPKVSSIRKARQARKKAGNFRIRRSLTLAPPPVPSVRRKISI